MSMTGGGGDLWAWCVPPGGGRGRCTVPPPQGRVHSCACQFGIEGLILVLTDGCRPACSHTTPAHFRCRIVSGLVGVAQLVQSMPAGRGG